MLEQRPRLSALICYLWTIALFVLSAWLFQQALTRGLQYFFAVFPEWFFWICVALSAIDWRNYYHQIRSSTAHFATRYWYHSSEPRFIGVFVEELCARRQMQLPCIYIDPNRYPSRATMLDDWQRPDVLRIEKNLVDGLKPRHVEAVLAHELRHSDALDTKLAGLCNLMKQVFSKLWFVGGMGYLVFADVGWGETFYRLGWGILLFLGYHIASVFVLLAIHRSLEYKADILACMDLGSPKDFVAMLWMIDRTGASWERIEKPAKWNLGAAVDRTLERIVKTHPSFAERRQAIERVYGPIELDACDREPHEPELRDRWSIPGRTLQVVS